MTIQHRHGPVARLDGGVDLAARAASAAAVAAAHAAEVDREARYPAEAVEALRAQRLLGAAIPIAFGGEGASMQALAEICYVLGRACASTAMIFAMHQTKVACLVRHGRGEPWCEGAMRRIADAQLLLASSTTEGQGGGNVRASAAAVEPDGDHLRLERAATVISYGAQADGIVTVARRAADAGASDQVLCVLLREDYELERLSGWETLGMRGTCSAGFRLRARFRPEQVLPARYADIHGQTMTPVSHLLWSSAWAGIAAGAVEKAQAFTRTAMRGAGGQAPPGALHYARAVSSLKQARALIAQGLDRFEAAADDPASLAALDFQTAITMLKVEVSELAVAAVSSALRANGLAGYRQDGDFSVGRALRDVLSAPIMIHNDRIMANLATATLMTPVAAALRD
ncbi:acyl-CoA dehydrogenase family protein [Methylobacterium nigriterrae]|uniref:acyl-CoA dehydrogenase family protein n=1 Tax=Methylobacterium nigriterrae TaxID=3127512 RepID=UPI0030134C7D